LVKDKSEKCDPDKTSSFRFMVDFAMIEDLKDEVIKPYITRYFHQF